jgi:hypothetical protein
VHKGRLDHKDQRVQLVIKVLKEKKERLVSKGHKERLVQPVLKELKGHKERLVHRVSRVSRVNLDLVVLTEVTVL